MIPLHTAEVGPSATLERFRPAFVRSLGELKRRRRVELGEHASLLFENRETILGSLHEIVRANNGWSRRRVKEEMDEHQHLLPPSGMLTGTFLLYSADAELGRQLCEDLAERSHQTLRLRIGAREVGAEIIAPLGALVCPVQYLRFPIGNDVSQALLDAEVEAVLSLRVGDQTIHTKLRRELRRDLSEQLADYGVCKRLRFASVHSLVVAANA